jgi:hypothetical protein
MNESFREMNEYPREMNEYPNWINPSLLFIFSPNLKAMPQASLQNALHKDAL